MAEQDQWLDEQLKVAQTSQHPVVIFQHIPWFLKDPESNEKNYFEIKLDLRKQMMDKFIDAGNKFDSVWMKLCRFIKLVM